MKYLLEFIGKGCQCNKEKDSDMLCLIIPENMIKLYEKNSLCITKCLQEEILFLWEQNIKVLNAACSKLNIPYIQVDKTNILKMYELGYQQYPHNITLWYPLTLLSGAKLQSLRELINDDSKGGKAYEDKKEALSRK